MHRIPDRVNEMTGFVSFSTPMNTEHSRFSVPKMRTGNDLPPLAPTILQGNCIIINGADGALIPNVRYGYEGHDLVYVGTSSSGCHAMETVCETRSDFWNGGATK